MQDPKSSQPAIPLEKEKKIKEILRHPWSFSLWKRINSLATEMTVKRGANPACAACKFQRRKCTLNCPLAPYFPANDPKVFHSVHRLFGVKNITNTLINLKTRDQKEDAMKSIMYEAEIRHRFPVHGCSIIIGQMRMQLQYAIDELRFVYTQLTACRKQGNKQSVDMDSWQQNEMICQYLLNENVRSYEELNHKSNHSNYNLSSRPIEEMQVQMELFGMDKDRNLFFYPEFEGGPFNVMMDDRQSSSGSLLKTGNSMDQICRTELQTAAAGFNLTTVN